MTTEIIRGDRAGVTVRQPDPPGPGELPQTPREIEGPYYRLGTPMRSNLLEPGDKPELVLSGRVLNEKGKPIPNAVVSLWSSTLRALSLSERPRKAPASSFGGVHDPLASRASRATIRV